MSEPSDASGQVPRRNPRVGDGGSPVSGAVAIVLAVVAVVAGFLILRSISDDGEAALDFPADEGSPSGDGGAADQDEPGSTADPSQSSSTSTTTTQPAIVTEGASVLVANANNVGGSAGEMMRALGFADFTVVDAVNASDAVGEIDQSVIYFNPENPQAQAVAESLAEVLGGVDSVSPLPADTPVQGGEMQGADVLLMLGNDKAGQELAELNPDAAGGGGGSEVTNPPTAGEGTTQSTAG